MRTNQGGKVGVGIGARGESQWKRDQEGRDSSETENNNINDHYQVPTTCQELDTPQRIERS